MDLCGIRQFLPTFGNADVEPKGGDRRDTE